MLFKAWFQHLFPMAQVALRHDLEAFEVINFPHLGLGLKIGEVYTKAELQRRCGKYHDKAWRINELERNSVIARSSKRSKPQNSLVKVILKSLQKRRERKCTCSCQEIFLTLAKRIENWSLRWGRVFFPVFD